MSSTILAASVTTTTTTTTSSTSSVSMIPLSQAQAAIASVESQYQFIVIICVVVAISMFAILALYVYGMGPFRGLVFYKQGLLLDITPDNGVTMRKVRRLRKALMLYTKKKAGDIPFRAGLLTSYGTAGGPRLYFRYSPSEMAMQMRLLPWLKKAELKMHAKWKYTPQNWEQLCILMYKDYIDKHLNDFEHPPTATESVVLRDDKALIEEVETGKYRQYLDAKGIQMFDTEGKPLFHAPHTIDERELLLDRAESSMISDNPEDLRVDAVDIKDAVMFRRSTFTDNDLSDAYSEGFMKAKDTQGRDNTRLFLIGVVAFMVMIGGAAVLSVIHVI